MVKAKDFFLIGLNKLKKNPNFLIELGAKNKDLIRAYKQKF